MADYNIDDTVDITDVVCPTTFVKAKVAGTERSAQHKGGGSQDPQAHQQQRRYIRPHR
mgnify:CR=1 FL=1